MSVLESAYVCRAIKIMLLKSISINWLQAFHGHMKQGGVAAQPQPPAPRPKVRARRGQATDPHSIAERVCLAVWLSGSSETS